MRNVEKTTLVMDIECYRDYFLVMFRRVDTGLTRHYEQYGDLALDVVEIRRIMSMYRIVTFNGINYDIPMLNLALRGASCEELKAASDSIIVGNLRGWQFEQQRNIKTPRDWDHIDLIEVAFGQGSLKLYGGRLHSKRLQDLPIDPSASISPAQRAELIAYCGNDLQTTIDLFNHLRPQIELRERMSAENGLDLRSKSDAQVAEAVLKKLIGNIIGPISAPKIPAGTSFKFTPPDWLRYDSDQLKSVFRDVVDSTFFVTPEGGVTMPPTLDGRSVAVGGSVYRMGIGGLHSSEQGQAFVADSKYAIIDRDVQSYYPSIILQCKLSPLHLREQNAFLRVYQGLVTRRLDAKKRGDKVSADALKTSINGSYGKLGSKYSSLYSPHLMIQVTLTGQLALLMLIERLEQRGVRVISGNTDGIVIHCERAQEVSLQDVIEWWERTTGFVTEETRYRAIFSRDVNSYVALKEGGGVKGKGAFAPVSIAKNPQNIICNEAVTALLDKGVPIEQTIRSCTDIRKFVTVRTVRGGGVQITHSRYDESLTPGKKRDVLLEAGWFQTNEGPLTKARFTYMPHEPDYDVETAYCMHCGEDTIRYLGKVVRFYIGHSSIGAIYYKEKNKSGRRNKVPRSDNAVPVMELPDEFPNDVNYEHYIREAHEILNDIGASEDKRRKLMFGESADLF
ncbi:DNA polymerase B region [Acidovorax phage ACPWH]|nr:DNA polymerase B region [Acidovorax phage ACPWH]QXV72228.1 DNA polymerase B region [Acidovorax phage ACF1]